MGKNNIKLFSIIIYENKKFKNRLLLKKLKLLIRRYAYKYIFIKSKNINNKILVKTIINNSKSNILMSLYPGEIVKNLQLIDDRICLHNHTGKLPNYRGSTTIYYSLLKEKKIYCTTFRIDKKIDEGKILYINRHSIPKKGINLDDYDNIVRAKNFVEFLKGKIGKNKTSLRNETYYTIHPILRNLAYKVINGNLDIG